MSNINVWFFNVSSKFIKHLSNHMPVRYGIVVFNVPLDIIGHFRDDFTRKMTQPTVW